jgi:hypothetical protein
LFLFCGCELLRGGVEAVDIGLVVVLVMEFHDLSGDGGLERTVIIWGYCQYTWMDKAAMV